MKTELTNILLMCYQPIPSFHLTINDFKRFSTVIPISVRTKLTRDITNDDVRWCDVLCCVRGTDPLSEFVVNEAKRIGVKVVLMLDDDLMSTDTSKNKNIEKIFKKSLLNIISSSDYMITSSMYLGEKYRRKYGINFCISDTVVAKNEIKENRTDEEDKAREQVKLLYAASPKHIEFYNELIQPILERLYERYADRICLTVIGPDVEVKSNYIKIIKHKSMSFDDYCKFMSNNNFDIGLAPIFDNEFCRSKYYNKYLEYSKNNICGVYSNLMPYNLIVKNDENGILANNTSDDWFNQLCKIIDSKEEREKCVKNAQRQIITDFSLESVSNRLYKDIGGLFDYKAPHYNGRVCRFMKYRYYIYAMKRKIYSLIYH